MNNEFKSLTVLTVLALFSVALVCSIYYKSHIVYIKPPTVFAQGTNIEDYVDQISNVDGSPDKGSHSNFDYMKATDNNYDTLTEGDYGSYATITYVGAGAKASGTGAVTPALPTGWQANDIFLLFCETANEAVTAPTGWTEVASSPQGTGTAGGTSATRLTVFWRRATSSETAPTIADPGDHICAGILAFRNVVETGNPWDVTVGDVLTTASTSVTIPGATTTVPGCMVVVAVATGPDTTTAQCSGWTNTNLQNLQELVDYYTNSGNGGGFGVAAGTMTNAGNYGSTTATVATSFVQGRISIALKPKWIPNYQLDLEVQWINVDYNQQNEYLCIKTGTLNDESLKVDVWTGSSWVNVIASLTANSWNNVSVSTYLTSSTFTIRFVGATESGDTVQSSWQVDSALLHLWTSGYNLNLRVMDYDLTDAISGAYVYKDSDVKVSDSNGWANWTLVSGTVSIKVKYFGFWVNGTFSVTMDSDKTIYVKCNLFDVTVNVRETVRSAKLANVNVIVFNGTSSSSNKIKSGISDNNGQVVLTNLPNNTLTFTLYGGSSYSLVIGNTTQLINSDGYSFTVNANQNYVNVSAYNSLVVYIVGSCVFVNPLNESLLSRLSKRIKKKFRRLRNA
jgi:hypothetical protein